MTPVRSVDRARARAARLLVTSPLLFGCSFFYEYEVPAHETGAQCRNDKDDDVDGVSDCDDSDCRAECPEDDAIECRDLVDNDGDGATDEEEGLCLRYAEIETGPFARDQSVDCTSRLGTSLGFLPEDPWAGTFSWVESTDDEPSNARFEGGEACLGSGLLAGACSHAWTTEPVSGGPTWALSLDIAIDAGTDTELVMVIGPDRLGQQSTRSSFPSSEDAIVVGARRKARGEGEDVLLFSLFVDGATAGRKEWEIRSPLPPWIRLDLRSGDVDEAELPAALDFRVLDASNERVLLSSSESEDHPSIPEDWESDTPFDLSLHVSGAGSVRVRNFSLERERLDPCDYEFPQIDAAARVFAAARSGGVLCVVGAVASAERRERVYCPAEDHGTPPWPLDTGPQRFAAWRTDDPKFESIEGPFEDLGPFEGNVYAAALDWSDEKRRFEGVLLASGDTAGSTRLLEIWSSDCATWQARPADELSTELGTLFPILYDASSDSGERRLLLARPGDGYAADPAAWYMEEDILAFVGQPDSIPLVKPTSSECMRYPRATLHEAKADDFDASFRLAPKGTLPALEGWTLACGPQRGLNLPTREWPMPVFQLLELGDTIGVLAGGRYGVELLLDYDSYSTSLTVRSNDAILLRQPLRGPSGIAGAFDSAAIGDATLVLPKNHGVGGRQEGVLVYRGFRAVTQGGNPLGVEEPDRCYAPGNLVLDGRGDTLSYSGGQIGIVPVRFELPR